VVVRDASVAASRVATWWSVRMTLWRTAATRHGTASGSSSRAGRRRCRDLRVGLRRSTASGQHRVRVPEGRRRVKSLGVLMVDREAYHGVHCPERAAAGSGRGRSGARWPGRSWAGGDVAIGRSWSTAYFLAAVQTSGVTAVVRSPHVWLGSWCDRGSNRAAWVVHSRDPFEPSQLAWSPARDGPGVDCRRPASGGGGGATSI
jgi:hypothetical protein